jgi:AraC-like DNA-binding protein
VTAALSGKDAILGAKISIQRVELSAGLYTVPEQASVTLHYRGTGNAQISVSVEQQEGTLFAGGYVFVPPKQAVHFRAAAAFERWTIEIPSSDAKDLAHCKFPHDYQAPRHDAALDCFFKLLQHHLRGLHTPDPNFVDIYERLLMMQLNRMYGDGEFKDVLSGSAEQVLRLGQFVDQRLAYDIGVEDMAKCLEMSKFQLLRVLRKALDTTPQQFLIERRIERAKQLLLESQAPLSDIALSTGFSSQSHFTNVFGQAMGLSPGAFRQAQRGVN